ncbi:JAB domain-containing protein [Planctomycetota bacterium]
MRESADIVGIQMLDHIIIGYDTYMSMFEQFPEFRK